MLYFYCQAQSNWLTKATNRAAWHYYHNLLPDRQARKFLSSHDRARLSNRKLFLWMNIHKKNILSLNPISLISLIILPVLSRHERINLSVKMLFISLNIHQQKFGTLALIVIYPIQLYFNPNPTFGAFNPQIA